MSCRQIAERRQNLEHYNQTADSFEKAILYDQVKPAGDKLVGSQFANSFKYKRAFDATKAVWDQGNFAAAKTRAEFEQRLDDAISKQV